jgi:hypothetical protein
VFGKGNTLTAIGRVSFGGASSLMTSQPDDPATWVDGTDDSFTRSITGHLTVSGPLGTLPELGSPAASIWLFAPVADYLGGVAADVVGPL